MAESLGNVFDTVIDNMQLALQQLEGDVTYKFSFVYYLSVYKNRSCHFFLFLSKNGNTMGQCPRYL
jgi:hypothetical protein